MQLPHRMGLTAQRKPPVTPGGFFIVSDLFVGQSLNKPLKRRRRVVVGRPLDQLGNRPLLVGNASRDSRGGFNRAMPVHEVVGSEIQPERRLMVL